MLENCNVEIKAHKPRWATIPVSGTEEVELLKVTLYNFA